MLGAKTYSVMRRSAGTSWYAALWKTSQEQTDQRISDAVYVV
jgi:hypothetical protein